MSGKARTCAICKKEFSRKHPQRWVNTVCSEECRKELLVTSKRKGKYLTCKQCSEKFWAKPYAIKNGAKFCSVKCWTDWKKRTHKELTCQWCGKQHKVTRFAEHNKKYCSVACHNYAQTKKVKVGCTICGNEVERKPSELKKYNAALCSQECANKYFLERIVFFQSHCNTKPERMFDEQTPDYINQTSNGKFYVNFASGKIKNPDFIVRPVNQTKKVIEVFGRYWHKPEEEADIVKQYKQVGYDCLVLWEEEVYENTYHDKLESFLSEPSAVLAGNGQDYEPGMKQGG